MAIFLQDKLHCGMAILVRKGAILAPFWPGCHYVTFPKFQCRFQTESGAKMAPFQKKMAIPKWKIEEAEARKSEGAEARVPMKYHTGERSMKPVMKLCAAKMAPFVRKCGVIVFRTIMSHFHLLGG